MNNEFKYSFSSRSPTSATYIYTGKNKSGPIYFWHSVRLKQNEEFQTNRSVSKTNTLPRTET